MKERDTRLTADQIPDTLKFTARKESEAMAREANAKGGVVELTNKLLAKTDTLAGHLMKIAADAVTFSKGDLARAAKVFGLLCNDAETHLKQREEVDNVLDVIPCWAAVKSTIRRAMEDYGINPTAEGTETYAKLRKAKQDAAEAARTKARAPHHNETGGTGAGDDEAPAVSLTSKEEGGSGKIRVTPKLLAAFNTLTNVAQHMTEEEQDNLADAIGDLVSSLNLNGTAAKPEADDAADDGAAVVNA